MKPFIILLLWLSWIAIAVGGWLTRHFMDYSHLLESVHGFLAALWFWLFVTVLGWSLAKRWFLKSFGKDLPSAPPLHKEGDGEGRGGGVCFFAEAF